MKYFVVLSNVLLWIALVASHCPDGWVGHGSSCYHFSHDRESMPVASLVCQHLGGDLVEINSLYENNYVFGHIRHAGFGQYWIGATDIQEEHVWKWYRSGKQLRHSHYTNWNPGEPNNAGKIENCAFMNYANGKWYDYTCYNFLNYVCETRKRTNQTLGWSQTAGRQRSGILDMIKPLLEVKEPLV